MPIDFNLRFDKSLIGHWSNRYNNPGETPIVTQIVPPAKAQGYLTKEQFLTLCIWKARSTHKRRVLNDEDFVRAVTATAFTTSSERLRIEVLTLLEGVDWPTASMILHLCGKDPYPNLDAGVLWALGVDMPKPVTFDFWWQYTLYCRKLAEETGVTMRILDRAMWQFAKETQTSGTPAKSVAPFAPALPTPSVPPESNTTAS